jgi:hypothetical protein
MNPKPGEPIVARYKRKDMLYPDTSLSEY